MDKTLQLSTAGALALSLGAAACYAVSDLTYFGIMSLACWITAVICWVGMCVVARIEELHAQLRVAIAQVSPQDQTTQQHSE